MIRPTTTLFFSKPFDSRLLTGDSGSLVIPVKYQISTRLKSGASTSVRKFVPLELIPQPPSLRKRRGLRSVSVSEALLPLSSQERGPGGEFWRGGRTSEQMYY